MLVCNIILLLSYDCVPTHFTAVRLIDRTVIVLLIRSVGIATRRDSRPSVLEFRIRLNRIMFCRDGATQITITTTCVRWKLNYFLLFYIHPLRLRRTKHSKTAAKRNTRKYEVCSNKNKKREFFFFFRGLGQCDFFDYYQPLKPIIRTIK